MGTSDADGMPRGGASTSAPGAFSGPSGWLPRGRGLGRAEFSRRHRLLCATLALHLPVLPAAALISGEGPFGALLATAPLLVLLGVSLAPLPRRPRAVAAALGLLSCSAVLAYLADGAPPAYFHFFAAVALLALYQDWIVYAAAVVFVAVEQAVAGSLSPGSVLARSGSSWEAAGLVAGFVLAEVVALVVLWHANEQNREVEERLRAQLSEGQSSVRARLEEADRIRADLIATVSHEFRTPLTGIRGAALTLLKRGDRLDEQSRQRLLTAVLDQQERLSRLLENMLTAARATAADPMAVAEVDGVAAEVAMLAGAARPESPPVSVVVEPNTVARIDRQALHQVLANLVDNAQQHGSRGAVPILAGGRDDAGVWVTVSNEGRTLDRGEAGRLFEPFTQAASGATREAEGMGMGLYVVRRLVEVYGGTVDVHSENDWITVEIRLRPGGAPRPAPTSELIAG